MALDVRSVPVPAQQHADGKAVAKIMQPWSVAVGRTPQAGLARERHEGGPDTPVGQSGTLFGNQEAGRPGNRITALPLRHIVAKGFQGITAPVMLQASPSAPSAWTPVST